jgi:putative heme transporter
MVTSGAGITDAGDQPHRPRTRSRWVQAAVSLGVLVLIFGFLFPKVADYGAVWETIKAMTPLERVSLAVVALLSVASFWPVLIAALPGLRTREAAVANLASTAVANTLPGGGALGVGVTITMQRSWGIAVGATVRAGLVVGVWSNFVKLGLPVIALCLLAATGEVRGGLVGAAVVGVIVLLATIFLFTLLLRSDRLARRIGALSSRVATAVLRAFGRGPAVGWDERASRFRAATVGLLARRWLRLTLTTIVSQLSLCVVLLLALRAVGVSEDELGWTKVLAGFAFIRLLSAVPITPGGLGVVELGLTAALSSGLPDRTTNQIAAAVLVYRALTWFVPIPLGILSWLFWRSNKSWRQSIDQRAQLFEKPEDQRADGMMKSVALPSENSRTDRVISE